MKPKFLTLKHSLSNGHYTMTTPAHGFSQGLKGTLALSMLFIAGSPLAEAQTAIYEFTGTSSADNQLNSVSSAPTGGTFSTFTRTNVSWMATVDVFSSTNWTTAGSQDTGEYVSFSLTPSAGSISFLTQMSFGSRVSSGTPSGQVRLFGDTSAAALASQNFSPPTSIANTTFNFTDIITAEALTFRIYAWGLAAGTTTLRFDNVQTTGASPNFLSNSADLTLAAATQLYAQSSALNLSGAISGGSNTLNKIGTNTATFSGSAANTYTGLTTVETGTMVLNKTAGVNAIAGNLTIGDNTATAGVDMVSLGASNQIADTATVTLNGTSTNAGILRLNGNSEAIAVLNSSSAGTGIVENNHASAASALTVSGASNSNFSGVIRNGAAGTLAMTKDGAGTLTLGGINTYTGNTTITTGTLALGSGGSISNSALITVGSGAFYDVGAVSGGYSLASGQTLQGTGTVTGAMTIASGSTISPGTSPGNLNTGNLTFAGAGNYNWQIVNATGTAGSGWDLITSSDTLNITATTGSKFNINLWSLSSISPSDVNGNATNFNNASNYSWKIVGAGNITGFSADKFAINTGANNGTAGFSNELNSGIFSVLQSGNDLNLLFTAADLGANLYWDGAGNWTTTAPGAGGTGTWADSTGGWDPSKISNFSGTAAAVTVGTATANKGINFLADGYSLSGGTITLSATPADNVITVGSGMTATISSAISTSAGIIKSGAGNLVFDTTQSYTGGTSVGAGTLTLGHATDTLGDSAALTVSGTLALGSNTDTVGSLSLTGGSITGSGTLTAATYSLGGGNVSANLGAGSATAASGTTALNGTLAGNLTVSGGTVNLGSSDRIGDSSAVSISSGTLGMGAFNDTVGTFSISGGALGGSGTLTAATYSLGGGTITANLGAGEATAASGTTSLSGTLDGNLTVSGGTVNLGSAERLGNSTTVLISSGTLGMGASNDTVGTFSISGGVLGGSGILTAATYSLGGGTITANLGAGSATAASGTTALNGTLAGSLDVTGGTVNLGSAERLGNSTAVSISSGALGMGTVNDTVGSFSLSGGALDGSTGTLTAATYALQGGTINARLGAGNVTVSTGTTTLGSAGRLTSTSNLAINSGQLSLGGNETVAAYTQTTGATLGGSGTLTAATYALGGGTVTASLGTGTATAASGFTALDGTLAGNLAVTGGTVTLGSSDRLGGTVAVSSGSLNLGGNTDTVGAVTLSGGSIQNGTLTGTSYALSGGTLSAGLAGTGAITAASGTTTLSGSSSGYSGATTVSGGTLALGSSTALGTSAVTVTSGSVIAQAGITNSNNFTIGTASGIASVAVAGWDFNGQSGFGTSPLAATTIASGYTVGSLTRGSGVGTAGSGASNGFGGDTWDSSTSAAAITANEFFSFSITATSGTLDLASIGAYNIRRSSTGPTAGLWQYRIGAGSFINLGSEITWGSGTSSTGNSQTAISLSGLGSIAANTTVTFRVANFGASSTGGTLYLNNFQTGNDLTINTSVVTPASGTGTLGIAEVGSTTFSGAITVNNTATLDAVAGGTAAFTGAIGGLGSITKTGDGIVTLSGNNTYAGNTTISGGTLQVGNGTNSGSIATTGGITNNAALVYNVGSGNRTLGAVISGNGTLTQNSAGGILTLTGNNTYTGATEVMAGSLLVNGSLDAASAVNVGASGTLGGNGTVGALALSGTLAPGAAGVVDIQTLKAGNTTWNGGSIWNFDLSSVSTNSDKLDITGNLVKGTGSGFVFDFMGSQPVWNTTYTLATFASFTGFTDGLDFTATNLGAGSYSTSYFTLNGTSLTFTAVPEPTSALVGLLIGAGLLRRRRNVGC
jgi:autotransporter-associated beta strand protein